MAVCEGSRPFTRYSYGDLLREDRPYDVVYRIWPGTQRVLLWGDPAMAAGFGRTASFAGSQGLEWCEPHSLKGREGTGLPGPRDGYADPVLSTPRRLGEARLHVPVVRPADVQPRCRSGDLAPRPAQPVRIRRRSRPRQPWRARAGSFRSSRPHTIPRRRTTTTGPRCTPTSRSSRGTMRPRRTTTTRRSPKRFGTVGPLDPEIFSGVADCVHEAITGRPSGGTPRGWLPDGWRAWPQTPVSMPAGSRRTSRAPHLPEVRRLAVDVTIQADLGRFFAAKLNAAVLYELSAQHGERCDARRSGRGVSPSAGRLGRMWSTAPGASTSTT